MRCPQCQAALEARQTPTGRWWACPHEHGAAATLPVVRSSGGARVVRLAFSPNHTRPHAGRPCPSCTHPLTVVAVPPRDAATPGVEVDLCARCQLLWFDTSEFEAVREALPAGAPPERPLPPEAARLLATARAAQVRRHTERRLDAPEFDVPDSVGEFVLELLGLPTPDRPAGPRRATVGLWCFCLLASIAAFAAGEETLYALSVHHGASWFSRASSPLLSPFVHSGPHALFASLFGIWIAGHALERRLGSAPVLWTFGAGALASAAVFLAVGPRGPGMVGAHAGVMALTVRALILAPRARFRAWVWHRFRRWRVRTPLWLMGCAWLLLAGALAAIPNDDFADPSPWALLAGGLVGVLLTVGPRWSWGAADV